MMRPVAMRHPPQPSLDPRLLKPKPMCGPVPIPGVSCEQPTTCVDNQGGYGALHKNQQRVCYTIPRWPGSRYQVTQATQMQRYSRAMAIPVLRQVMPAGMVPPGRPRAAMVTIRTATPLIPPGPLMRTPQGWAQQKMIQNQPLQLYNQAPQNATMNPQLIMNQPPAQTVTGYNGVYSSHYFPRVDYPMFQNQHQQYLYQASESTSTAPPITSPTMSTTSTMPPYPGGIKPDSDDHSGSFLLCGNKAKCNKYVWTTKKKSATKKLREEELVLW